MTNYSRSVLKSNGLPRPKIRLKKFDFSSKTVPANIAKKLPSQRCSQPLFNFSHKRLTFAFTGESGYTLGFQRKIAHKGTHGETGRISDWVLSLLSERSARSQTSPGRVSERRTLPLWGLGQGCSQRTQRAFGTAMRLCASLFRRRRGPAGLRDLFVSDEITVFTPCAQGLSVCARRGVVSLPSERSTRFGNPAWPGGRTASFAAFGAWSGVLPKNAESLRNSDALMRVAVPRRRGPAGLRDLFATW